MAAQKPPIVRIDAASRDTGMAGRAVAMSRGKRVVTDVALMLWRRLIDTAVADAKKTEYGVPTYEALAARWWLVEHRPAKTDKDEWACSFGCCCSWLGIDETTERRRIAGEVQASLRKSAWKYAEGTAYVRRAEMLTCMGIATAIARQFVLGLVTHEEYKVMAGVDEAEKPARLFDEGERVDRKRSRAA